MGDEGLRRRTEAVKARLTGEMLQEAVLTLWRQEEDLGGGVNADRVVRHLLDGPRMRDEDVVWAYDQLKPLFRDAFEEDASFCYFEGD